jgi:hypothetical protein
MAAGTRLSRGMQDAPHRQGQVRAMLRSAASHAAHLLVEALLGVAGVVTIAGCVLVWRLGQGPIDITEIVHRAQHLLPGGAAQLSLGTAALAWEGFHDPDSSLDIRFTDLSVTDAAGLKMAQFPAGRLTLAAAPLWTGAVLPRTLVLDRAAITLWRGSGGAVRLDLSPNAATSAPAAPPSAAPFITNLTQPGALPILAELRQVRLRDATVSLHDAAWGVLWRADGADFVARRDADGNITGTGVLELAVGAAHAHLATQASLTPAGLDAVASVTDPVSPAEVARAVPALAQLAAIDAPLTAAGSVHFDAGLRLRDAALFVAAGRGSVRAGNGRVALASAAVEVRTDGARATLQNVRIALEAPPGATAPAPLITGQAAISGTASEPRIGFAVSIDRMAFADLPAYWPTGIGGGTRPWLAQNITAGIARNLHVNGVLDEARDGTGMSLTSLAGGLDGHDMTVHWLRPIPPMEHTEAHLTVDGPDAVHIYVQRAVQGRLSLSASKVRIAGLSAKDQTATIVANIGGDLPEVLGLLNHPRLNLLSRTPFEFNAPAGQVAASLDLVVPLDARVSMDALGVTAAAKLTGVHLGSVAAGRDLDDATLTLALDASTLSLRGDGRLGGVPARLGLSMDLRAGRPEQTRLRVTATGRASEAELVPSWLPAGIMTAGEAGLDADYTLRRDGNATVGLHVDATDAALATPVGWTKPAGAPAQASAKVTLQHDRLTGIDAISASGPGLRLTGRIGAQAGRVATLVLQQAQLGNSDLHGTIALPGGGDPRWRVMLRGPMLDLTGYLKQRDRESGAPQDDTKGPPWQADLAFDRVSLAADEVLAPVDLKATSDGLHFTSLDVSAGGGTAAQVRASITPAPGGRALNVDAADAGAVLLAAGIADNIRGGQLKLTGTFDDSTKLAPLTGTARLDRFRVTDAPAIGRLLQAMTLYGSVDLLRGPGLGFTSAVVPFRWQQRVLQLRNARAFSASLGLTAQGEVDFRHHTAKVTGTIVPAYFFNQLLGKIPLVGKLFSPETGGGVFAARYSVRGNLRNPSIGINPLSALTPGALRGIFGAF